MKLTSRQQLYLTIFILAILAALFIKLPNKPGTAPFSSPYVIPEEGEWALVTRVVDGDTIELEDGRKVRYIGVDTPETKHPTKGVEPYGYEASEANRRLVLGKRVLLVKDVSETDRYDRLLRYVFLDDGTFVNLKLVEDGYARVATFPPDVKYADLFLEAERKAREEGRGLWGVEGDS